LSIPAVQVAQLATVNNRLNLAMSLPVILFLVNYTLDIMVALLYTVLRSFSIGNLLFIVTFVSHLLWIVYLCGSIDRALQRIAAHQVDCAMYQRCLDSEK